MTETICSTDGTKVPSRATTARRHAGWLAMALLAAAMLVAGGHLHLHQRAGALVRSPSPDPCAGVLAAAALQTRIRTLNDSVLDFQFSGDAAARDTFRNHAGSVDQMLDEAGATPVGAEPPVAALRRAFQIYLEQTAPLLDQPLRPLRRDAAVTLRQEIQALAVPLLTGCDDLLQVRQSAARDAAFRLGQDLAAFRRFLLLVQCLTAAAAAAFLGVLGWRLARDGRAGETPPGPADARHERLASLGILAAGVAHEIRNPLTAIKFRLFSVRQALPADLADNEDLGVIENEIHRLDDIVKGFLQFARPAEPRLSTLPARRLVLHVQDLLREELDRRSIRFEVHAPDDLALRADESQLQQVLINLVQNAADAIGRDGTITLGVRLGVAPLSGRSRPAVILEVADTGPGIAPEAEERLFEPFFSTRQGGTGLGLAIAARIVELHGGTLQYTTAPGRGTTFSIVLPRPTRDESPPPAH